MLLLLLNEVILLFVVVMIVVFVLLWLLEHFKYSTPNILNAANVTEKASIFYHRNF